MKKSCSDFRKLFQIFEEGKKKKSKYRNSKTEVDGIIFDSKSEAERYKQLCFLRRIGKVKKFSCQPGFDLAGKVRYFADFWVIYPDGEERIEDVKGVETKVFKIKRKLFEERYPLLKLVIIPSEEVWKRGAVEWR